MSVLNMSVLDMSYACLVRTVWKIAPTLRP